MWRDLQVLLKYLKTHVLRNLIIFFFFFESTFYLVLLLGQCYTLSCNWVICNFFSPSFLKLVLGLKCMLFYESARFFFLNIYNCGHFDIPIKKKKKTDSSYLHDTHQQ